MSKVTIEVDGKEIEVEEGKSLLFALLDAGIFVPNLCAMPDVDPPAGSCRLCWVEIEGHSKPATSCSQKVTPGMRVRTRSKSVDRLVRSGIEMLLSVHRLDCKDCPGNRRCMLQKIAKERKIPLAGRRFDTIDPNLPVDESRPDLGFNPNHCVLCERCVVVCNQEVKKGVLDMVKRGLVAKVSTFDGQPLSQQICGSCTRCAEVCPVGALYKRENGKESA